MRKILEMYEADNGIIVKKSDIVYHLFSAAEHNESIESVKIGTAKEAFDFLIRFFSDKLKTDTRRIVSETTFEDKTIIRYFFD